MKIMGFETNITVILYIILGAVLGIVWSLRKIYSLERNIASLDVKIEKFLEKGVKKR